MRIRGGAVLEQIGSERPYGQAGPSLCTSSSWTRPGSAW
jgi:hypothetical protein